MNFVGSFLSSRKLLDGRYQCGRFTVLPAPNRYRKMISTSGSVCSWSGGSFDNAAVIKRQSEDYAYPNPIGIEFDLFDCYLAWEGGDEGNKEP